jgi:hypothetical protein
MTTWTPLTDETPADNQYCRVLLDDGSESRGYYWAPIRTFGLIGPSPPESAKAVTHWEPIHEEEAYK